MRVVWASRNEHPQLSIHQCISIRDLQDFGGDIDDASAVDHVIGRVENATPKQIIGTLRAGELIVRGARNHPRLEAEDYRFIDDAAHRTGREDLDVGIVDGVRLDRFRVEIMHCASHRSLVDIGDNKFRSSFSQEDAQARPNMSESLNRDPSPIQRT